MSELSIAACETPAQSRVEPRHHSSSFFQNVLANLLRVATVSLVALILPAFLIHRLSVQSYAAWVLIIQLAAYISYLDLGIQTSVAKFVAEYTARNEREMAGRYASAGLGLMIVAGFLGLFLTLVLAWRVPHFFSAMPEDLHWQVRASLLLIGFSLSFGLVCAVYASVFLGLQRYWIPTFVTVLNRFLFVAVVIIIVAFRGNLAAMGLGVAIVNVATGTLQIIAWRRQAFQIPVSINLLSSLIVKRVARFCSMQSIWTAGMLCVSGLDVVIVGHYDYLQTAYYGIATMPTNFLLLLVGSVMNPLLPASSALNTQRSPQQMGNLLTRFTRYNTILVLLTGLPLIVYGRDFLRIWVGPEYAAHTVIYLRILVFANMIRNLCAPYATMITALGKQEAAIAAAVSEAVVNVGSSIYLASRFGAIGVAVGTVLGAVVSVALHFVITMQLARQDLAISRSYLFLRGLLPPLVIAIPSILLYPAASFSSNISIKVVMMAIWGATTIWLAWAVALDAGERSNVIRFVKGSRLMSLGAV